MFPTDCKTGRLLLRLWVVGCVGCCCCCWGMGATGRGGGGTCCVVIGRFSSPPKEGGRLGLPYEERGLVGRIVVSVAVAVFAVAVVLLG